ncbi:MAG: hypothetical protein JWM07_599 [Candidatus Saccharibacteria bacterium]|nr:hypothetical protein [Candidatus Saccharibacteria bacterium]
MLTRTLRSEGGVVWTDNEDVLYKLLELGVAIDRLLFFMPLGADKVNDLTMDTVMILFLDED